MPLINIDLHIKMKATLEAMRNDRLQWWGYWRVLADMYSPRRYVNLLTIPERKQPQRNTKILDSTGTIAARILASGMYNGVTSPSRRWFRFSLRGFAGNEPREMRVWLDEVERIVLQIMAQSNFYESLAEMYIDLAIFGSAAILIYEDRETVIRCYNSALGEFYFAQSDRLQINTFAREFVYKVHQVVEKWGLENVSDGVKDKFNLGGARLQDDVSIVHLIEPNVQGGIVPRKFPFRELYWERSGTSGLLLDARGFNEMPGMFVRWDVTGNASYGGSPGMDALGDVIQLQHETKAKGQSLDLMNRPPLQLDISLQHKPTAILPGGQTFIAGMISGGNPGIRTAYQVNAPIGEISQDLRDIQARIRDTFYNPLFNMISQLDTTRSATEIVARQDEKLVLLGSVLEKIENEALDPGVSRIFNIGARGGLFPPMPQGFEKAGIEIQYESILSAAQRAVGTASTERFLALIGEVVAVNPRAKNVPDWDNLLVDYSKAIGVSANSVNSLERIKQLNDADDAAERAAVDAEIGSNLAQGAKNLSQADVGGGVNALEILAGGSR